MPGASFAVPAPWGLPNVVGLQSVAGQSVAGQSVAGQSVAGPPVAGPPPATTRRFARSTDEVPVARRFIRDILADHPGCADAELLACELVTNAVQHASDAAGVMVAVVRCGMVVHVDVIDDGHVGLPHWRDPDGQDEGGRGFHLVNEIAQRWGFVREQAGTCVWFEISC